MGPVAPDRGGSAIEMTYRRLRRTGRHATRVSAEPVRHRRSVVRLRQHRVKNIDSDAHVVSCQPLRRSGLPKIVIGVSGGLDSTCALIVSARAMDREGRPRSDILAFTLPGFATGGRTKATRCD